jgi:hypothetical protein
MLARFLLGINRGNENQRRILHRECAFVRSFCSGVVKYAVANVERWVN